MNWADGGRTVTWIFGPTYHRLALDKAVPTPKPGEAAAAAAAEAEKAAKKKSGTATDAKKDEKKKLPESEQIEIVLTAAAREAHGSRRLHRRAHRHDEGRRGDRERRRRSSRAIASRPSAPPASVQVPAGATSVDVHGPHDHPRALRRARPPALLDARHLPAAALEVPGEPGLRRDHDARPLGRDAGGVRPGGDGRGRPDDRPAHLLDRLHPVRRRRRREGGRQEPRRRAPSRPPPEVAGRVQREVLHAAAPRAAAVDPRRRRARRACWSCPRAAAISRRT